jgi:hypothetical protein
MSDLVTLPREVVEKTLVVLEYGDGPRCECFAGCWECDPANAPNSDEAIQALRAALAAEQPLPSSTPIQQMVEEMIAESPAMALYLRDARRQYIFDAARWRFYEAAGSDLTLRLHNTRNDHRNSVIDAAMKEDKS